MSKVWFITGAGRGMGTDIAKAALNAGYKVVATGRNTDKVVQAVGPSENLLVVKLDVTNPSDSSAMSPKSPHPVASTSSLLTTPPIESQKLKTTLDEK